MSKIKLFDIYLVLKFILLIYLTKNIIFLRTSKKLKQKDLAIQLNVKPNTYSYYEQGKTTPSYKNLIELARIFEVSLDDLLTKDLSNSSPRNDIKKKERQIITLYTDKRESFSNPIVPIKARAAYFSDFFQEEETNIKYIELPFFESFENKRTFEVEGDSMIPKFQTGDYVVCKAIENPHNLKSKKYYVIASRQEGILLKKVINDKARKHYLLISENNEYPPILRHWSEIDEIWEVIYKITNQI